MSRFSIPLLVFAALGLLLGLGLYTKPRDLPSPRINQPAPAFALPQLGSAQPVFYHAPNRGQMAGKVWLLNVWASWCEGCRDEHSLIAELAQTIPIVGLNYKDADADARGWLREFGNPYAHTPVDANGEVAIEYGVYGVPETYLIDANGVIRFKHTGPLTVQTVEEILLPRIHALMGGSNARG